MVRRSDGGAPSLDGEVIEICRRGGRVHARSVALGLHASAGSADAAFAEIERKLAELKAFEAASGLGSLGRVPMPGTGTTAAVFKRIAVPVLIGGLIAMQLGWALSLGISSGLGRAFDTSWRDGLVLSLERQVLALAEPRHDLGAEERKRLLAAVRALKARYGPVWQEIVAGDTPGGE